MADAAKTKPTAELEADKVAEIDEAANKTTERETTARDRGTEAARRRELDRQDDVVAAVAGAHADELPKLGGPLRDPGLGR